MKKFNILLFAISLICSSLSPNYFYSQENTTELYEHLRAGIDVDERTLLIANELYEDGWKYIMPKPKSSQASWYNSDGRTTWWYGYWENGRKYSKSMPTKDPNGNYIGDGINMSGVWRRGGAPSKPSQIEWLLSNSGGVKPMR